MGELEHHALGRSRGGFGTKLHLVVDSHDTPLAPAVSPGQRHESKFVEPVIPMRKDQRPNPHFDRSTYRRGGETSSNAWSAGSIKEKRRLAMRYEKLAVNLLAMVKLAMIQPCVRLLPWSNRG